MWLRLEAMAAAHRRTGTSARELHALPGQDAGRGDGAEESWPSDDAAEEAGDHEDKEEEDDGEEAYEDGGERMRSETPGRAGGPDGPAWEQ